MHTPVIDPLTLTSFPHAAAGHEGPLSDPDGALFIKPCTQTEIDFYEAANVSAPELVAFMPTYLGTLSLGHQAVQEPLVSQALEDIIARPPHHVVPGHRDQQLHVQAHPVLAPLKGKKLNTDVHIVLQNIAAGFTRANVLDLKLGARLWDDDAAPDKRARLDKVSNSTTSGSLGFRIAGMRTYQGSTGQLGQRAAQAAKHGYGELETDTNTLSYNKLFGRQFTDKDVINGFRDFVLVSEAGIGKAHALGLVSALLDGTKQLLAALQTIELRLYSASILYVYEGDGEAFDRKHEAAAVLADESTTSPTSEHPGAGAAPVPAKNGHTREEDESGDENDEDDDADLNAVLSVKLIDFAHAHFVPGQGPDENILRGIRSIVQILECLQQEFA